MRTRSIVLLIAVCCSMAFSQTLSQDEREILTLQDQRSLGNGKLLSYLSNKETNLRYRAVLALANLQDSTTITPLLPLLNDNEPKVRSVTAFALGQIGSAMAQDPLVSRLNIEKDGAVISRLVEALGKCGNEQALDVVTTYKPKEAASSLNTDLAMSIVRFALRGIKNEQAMWYCFDMLEDKSADARWTALYALWRMAPHGLIDVEISKRRDELGKLAADPSADVRMNLATLLGRSKSSDAIDILRKIQKAERQKGDWRTQVKVVQALAALIPANNELLSDFLEYLNSPNDHVKIATLQAMSALSRQLMQTSKDTAKFKLQLSKLASTKNNNADLVRGEAMVTLGRHFPDGFVKGRFLEAQDLSVREKTKAIEAMSFIPTGQSLISMLKYLDDDSVRVAMAGWDFVRRFLTPASINRMRQSISNWEEIRSALYKKTLFSLQRNDMALTNLVANALGDTSYFHLFNQANEPDSLVATLNSAYGKLSSPNDVETMQAVLIAMGRIGDKRFLTTAERALQDADKTVATSAAVALQALTGKDYSDKIPQATRPSRTDFDWDALESIKPDQIAIVTTSKGIVKIQLLKDDAPFTVLNFVKLAKKNFYNGLTFHRVVPNFVVQGGDPRGDGWGGP
ncbi:MAG: HEAT repeat domain-containing protein, partial [Ignavibacteriales bacterium]|nr:HEAT repeat domain-containing protein [Ignavibacteriales bacterium]